MPVILTPIIAVISAGFWGIVFLALPPRQTPASGRSWLRLIAVAVVLLAGAARRAAAEDDAWSVSPCDCARQPVCWSLAMKAYAQRVAHSKAEVDGSLPNRFFPQTETFALDSADKQGNFLSVTCGPRHGICGEKRDELQRRLVIMSFLSSLPLSRPEGALYHPVTWSATAEGETVVAELRRCRPGLFDELAAVVVAGKKG